MKYSCDLSLVWLKLTIERIKILLENTVPINQITIEMELNGDYVIFDYTHVVLLSSGFPLIELMSNHLSPATQKDLMRGPLLTQKQVNVLIAEWADSNSDIHVSINDQKFLLAMLEKPPTSNAKLKEAMDRYKLEVENGTLKTDAGSL